MKLEYKKFSDLKKKKYYIMNQYIIFIKLIILLFK